MKRIFLVFFILFSCNFSFAKDCEVVCPEQTYKVVEDENFISKITGFSFITKKVMELALENELRKSLTSEFNANLTPFNIKRLKKGEFKFLDLKSDKLKYKALSISNFNAQTVCSYNKILYKNKKIYFPTDLPFKYKGEINNHDLKNVLNSQEFQKQLSKTSITIKGINGFKILTPTVEIKNGFVFFTIPIKTIFSSKPFNIKFLSNIEIQNNKVELKNITFLSMNNIINNDFLVPIINQVNPISFEFEEINSKYCKLYITNVKISDNIISTEGVFIINKNYGEENE